MNRKNSFAKCTGLKVNYSKSMMVPINITPERFDVLAQIFGCSKGSLLFTYLGLPLSMTRPTVAIFGLSSAGMRKGWSQLQFILA